MISILAIECEEIISTSTTKRGQDNAHLRITLSDVRIDELMSALIEKAGVQAILDHISDTKIKNYLKEGK